jgi:hypothetical protein
MNLKDILSISGKGGLFKFISQGRTGIIVESFEDKKRTVVHSSSKVSALEDIAIFTDVFGKIYEKENGNETISHKSTPEELKMLMGEILPDYDKERVYVSDMKKLVHWYNFLVKRDLLKPDEEEVKKDEKEGKDTREKKTAKQKADARGKTRGMTQQRIQAADKAKPTGQDKSVKANIPRQKAK